jgi:glycosyltransferase involved in cell wall biosynthesis
MINTTQYDNLPGVVQEAMSCGTAVVASKVGGLPNMIDHGVSGILADSGSPRAFADAVQMLLRDVALRDSLGAQARLAATERYDSKRVATDMISVYRRSRDARAGIG